MINLKEPLSYEEQIRRLRDFHNLVIEDDNKALKILSNVNYYRISAYGIGLTKEDNPEEYVDGTTLDKIYRLYEFDSKLRALLYKTIEYLEIRLRTQVAYCLAMKYGPEGYMDINNFIDVINAKEESVFENIKKHFNDEKIRQNNLPIVKHHESKYEGRYPVWVALELFTFGNLCSLYSIMKPEDKQIIAKLYNTENERLKSWILALVEMRNICAHYGRIYNMPLKQRPKLFVEHQKYQSKVTKLFPLIIVIKRMLKGESEWENFSSELSNLLLQYKDCVNLSFMSFPKEWRQVLEINN